jgi:hypothetical protein
MSERAKFRALTRAWVLRASKVIPRRVIRRRVTGSSAGQAIDERPGGLAVDARGSQAFERPFITRAASKAGARGFSVPRPHLGLIDDGIAY